MECIARLLDLPITSHRMCVRTNPADSYLSAWSSGPVRRCVPRWLPAWLLCQKIENR
jgi:hypothetical protein